MFSAGSASSAGYYTAGGGGEASYYLDATTREEPPGQWSGQLATKLGLEGQVDPKDFKSLLEEFTAPDGTTLGQPARQYKTTDQLVAAALEREPDALPERVEEIRREAEGKTRTATLGWDYTFAPPKSVTVAHTALWRAEIEAEKAGDLDAAREARAGRMTIEGLMWEANAAGLAYADANLQSRPGWHGGRGTAGRWVDAGSTARASYFQHTTRASREGQPEEREWTVAPQLHIHNVFINRALNGDGEYRAIDGDTVYGIRRAMSAVADHALREGLERRGIKTEIDEKGNWTIASIPKEAIALFSERHAKITATARPWIERAEDALGRPLTALETTRIMQKATLFSRDSKKHSEDDTFEDMIGQWQQSLARETGQGLAPIATRILLDMANRPETVGEQFSPSSVAATAMAEVSKNRSAWTRAELMLEISKQLPVTGVSADRTAELIDKIADLALATDGVTQVSGRNPYGAPAELTHGVYDCPAARKYATPGTLEAEDAIRQTAITKSGWNLTKKEASAWLDANRPNLGEEMRAVVIGLVTTRANLATLQGAAGTGKSTAAGAAAQMWSELVPGGKWHGLATGENAAQVLKGDGMEVVANID